MTRRVPAEWEPQQAVWLTWPHSESTWPGRLERMPAFFAKWACQIAESTPVFLLTPESHLPQAKSFLGTACNRIEIVIAPTNDCWIRDYGPTFVRTDRGIEAVDWKYNAWGGKYPPWDQDAAAAKQICDHVKIPSESSDLCLEGGALEHDGMGRLITTPECLVTDTRNPGWSSQEVASELHARLGVHEIVWLTGGGLEGDDTDGHVDQLARFTDPRNIVCAVSNARDDPNSERLETNFRQLRLWARSTYPQPEIHPLPIPMARQIDGTRVPESYCNFLMLSRDRVLVPVFGQKTFDDQAIGILSELCHGAHIEPIDCQDLVWGLGALHCASRDQPRE